MVLSSVAEEDPATVPGYSRKRRSIKKLDTRHGSDRFQPLRVSTEALCEEYADDSVTMANLWIARRSFQDSSIIEQLIISHYK